MSIETLDNPKHETVLDVTEERIALTYAEALMGAAAGSEWDALSELEAIVNEVLNPHPQFAEAIRSAFLSHHERVDLIDRVLGGRVSQVVLNFLKVLSAHNRLGILRTIARQARFLYEQRNNNVRVEVRSAQPLPEDVASDLESAVRARTGKEPIVTLSVDPDLIAGLVVRIGDTVFDGSLKTTVAKARKSILARTIEQIERNPDSFLSSE